MTIPHQLPLSGIFDVVIGHYPFETSLAAAASHTIQTGSTDVPAQSAEEMVTFLNPYHLSCLIEAFRDAAGETKSAVILSVSFPTFACYLFVRKFILGVQLEAATASKVNLISIVFSRRSVKSSQLCNTTFSKSLQHISMTASAPLLSASQLQQQSGSTDLSVTEPSAKDNRDDRQFGAAVQLASSRTWRRMNWP